MTITYGHEHYITQTLDGVLMQDYPGEIEFIIANDNSPDQTDKVIMDYLSSIITPPNFIIKYTKHTNNKKAVQNLIWALEQSSGEYIAFCEGDDYWIDKGKLQKQIDLLENNTGLSACFTSRQVINNHGNVTAIDLMERKVWTLRDIYDNATIFHFQTLVGRNNRNLTAFLQKFPQSYGADAKISYFFCSVGKVISLPDVTSVYRHNGAGIWSHKSEMERIRLNIVETLIFYRKIIDGNLDPDVTYKGLKIKLFRRIFHQRIAQLAKNPKSIKDTFKLIIQFKPPVISISRAVWSVLSTYFSAKKTKNSIKYD